MGDKSLHSRADSKYVDCVFSKMRKQDYRRQGRLHTELGGINPDMPRYQTLRLFTARRRCSVLAKFEHWFSLSRLGNERKECEKYITELKWALIALFPSLVSTSGFLVPNSVHAAPSRRRPSHGKVSWRIQDGLQSLASKKYSFAHAMVSSPYTKTSIYMSKDICIKKCDLN